MNKIRVIDLLNKIANGEKIPKKIKYDEMIWILKETPEDYDYYNEDEEYLLPFLNEYITLHFALTDILRWEVEILDEEDEFEEFDTFKSFTCNVGRVDESNIEEYIHTLFKQQTQLINNQKKIIDKLKDSE